MGQATVSEQEQSILMAKKPDNDLIKYAERHCTCVDGRVVIRELARRYKKLLIELEQKVVRI